MEKQKEDIVILAIESSCDETAAAVVRNGREICSNIISSQIELHKLYGGVASNGSLRLAMAEACEKAGIRFYYPSPVFCTDNAAMIGVAAYYEYIKGTRHGWDLNAVPNLKLGER